MENLNIKGEEMQINFKINKNKKKCLKCHKEFQPTREYRFICPKCYQINANKINFYGKFYGDI